MQLTINIERLMARIFELGQVGALPGGGVCRLALTDEDKAGRDLVISWMLELGMSIQTDYIGNVIALRKGRREGPCVMLGSHIDTVATGGLYDGNLGVLAGLEVVHVLNDANMETEFPLAVAFFTNEEGARFQPDMLGSSVYGGTLPLAEALAAKDNKGISLGDELKRIGYTGEVEPGFLIPRAYLELHVEQGPVLERKNMQIGCVTGVQGISWQELTITGVSNHAGTTPMNMRQDAGYAAAAIMLGVRAICDEMGAAQVGTCGYVELQPNLVNVIARKAMLTVDLRNIESEKMLESEQRLQVLVDRVAEQEKVDISLRRLCRFEPILFDERMVSLVTAKTREAGLTHMRMPSGAGHDAGLMANICPVGMVFVPSVGGISHNVKEYTSPEDIEAGANVFLQCTLDLLQDEDVLV